MKNLLVIMVAAILVNGCVPSREKVRMHANDERYKSVEIVGMGDTAVVADIREHYTSLNAKGSWSVVFTDSVSQPMLVVDKELLKYVQMRVKQGELMLGYTRSIKFRNSDCQGPRLLLPYDQRIDEIELSGASSLRSDKMIETNRLSIEMSGASKVAMKGLKTSGLELDMSGASEIEMENLLVTGEMDVEMSGSSRLKVRGKANRLEADVSGASEVRTAEVEGKFDFVTESAEVEVSGSAEVVLHCDGMLEVESSGASSVTYSGEPMLTQEVSGASEVVRN